MKTPDNTSMKTRQDAAVALQKLCFRATQANGFVTIEDCMEVTDKITIAIIHSFQQYLALEESENVAS